MLIAITANENTLDSAVSEKFGRCQYFIIVDSETMKFEPVLNSAKDIQSGAGPKAAEIIIAKGASVIITGRVGDKAEEALKKGNIKIVTGLEGNIKVNDALTNYLSKEKQEN